MGKKLDSDIAQKLLAERADGANASSLSKKYNIAESTIRGLFKRNPAEPESPKLKVVEIEEDAREAEDDDDISAAEDDDLLEAINGGRIVVDESPEDDDDGYEPPSPEPEREPVVFDMEALKNMINESEAQTTVKQVEKNPTTPAVAAAIEDEADVRGVFM